jgi:tRNA(Ile)-lysidine synthase TilS/MesJ
MNKERLEDSKDKAIRFIQAVAKASKVPLYAGNSGGKDSAVLDYLLKESGIKYISQYSNTTIDPPGTLGHIRKNYPHTEIIQPELSFGLIK